MLDVVCFLAFEEWALSLLACYNVVCCLFLWVYAKRVLFGLIVGL